MMIQIGPYIIYTDKGDLAAEAAAMLIRAGRDNGPDRNGYIRVDDEIVRYVVTRDGRKRPRA